MTSNSDRITTKLDLGDKYFIYLDIPKSQIKMVELAETN